MTFDLEKHPLLKEGLDNLKEDMLTLFLDEDFIKYIQKNKYKSQIINILSSVNFVQKIYFYAIYGKISDKNFSLVDTTLEISEKYMSDIEKVLLTKPDLYSLYQFNQNNNRKGKSSSFLKFYEGDFHVELETSMEELYEETLKLMKKVKSNYMRLVCYSNLKDSILKDISINQKKENYIIGLKILEKIKKDYLLTLEQEIRINNPKNNELIKLIISLEEMSFSRTGCSHIQAKSNREHMVKSLYEYLDQKDNIITYIKEHPSLSNYKDFYKGISLFNINDRKVVMDEEGRYVTEFNLNRYRNNSLTYYNFYLDPSKYKGKLNDNEQDIINRLKNMNLVKEELELKNQSKPLSKNSDLYLIEEINEETGKVYDLSVFANTKKDDDLSLMLSVSKKEMNFYGLEAESYYKEQVESGKEPWILYAKNINSGTQRVFKLFYNKEIFLNEYIRKEDFNKVCGLYLTEVLNSHKSPDFSESEEEFKEKRKALSVNIEMMISNRIREFFMRNKLLSTNKVENNRESKRKI